MKILAGNASGCKTNLLSCINLFFCAPAPQKKVLVLCSESAAVLKLLCFVWLRKDLVIVRIKKRLSCLCLQMQPWNMQFFVGVTKSTWHYIVVSSGWKAPKMQLLVLNLAVRQAHSSNSRFCSWSFSLLAHAGFLSVLRQPGTLTKFMLGQFYRWMPSENLSHP